MPGTALGVLAAPWSATYVSTGTSQVIVLPATGALLNKGYGYYVPQGTPITVWSDGSNYWCHAAVSMYNNNSTYGAVNSLTLFGTLTASSTLTLGSKQIYTGASAANLTINFSTAQNPGISSYITNNSSSTVKLISAQNSSSYSNLTIGNTTYGSSPVAIGGVVNVASNFVVTVQSGSSFSVGQSVILSGFTPSSYNGDYLITAVTSTSITVAGSTSGLGASTTTGFASTYVNMPPGAGYMLYGSGYPNVTATPTTLGDRIWGNASNAGIAVLNTSVQDIGTSVTIAGGFKNYLVTVQGIQTGACTNTGVKLQVSFTNSAINLGLRGATPSAFTTTNEIVAPVSTTATSLNPFSYTTWLNASNTSNFVLSTRLQLDSAAGASAPTYNNFIVTVTGIT